MAWPPDVRPYAGNKQPWLPEGWRQGYKRLASGYKRLVNKARERRRGLPDWISGATASATAPGVSRCKDGPSALTLPHLMVKT